MKLMQMGVGTETHEGSVRDTNGTSLLPIQAKGDGVSTFRVMGRVHPDADWVEIIAPGTADFLQAISWVPYLQLEITSGDGMVELYIAEQ